jgi:hypothetical protein
VNGAWRRRTEESIRHEPGDFHLIGESSGQAQGGHSRTLPNIMKPPGDPP